MFENSSREEILNALDGRLGPEAEVAAVTEAMDGDFGPQLQDLVLANAVQGRHGDGLREEAAEIAVEEGFAERWQQEAQAEELESLESDPEHQEEALAAEVEEAEERMSALLAAEADRLEERYGPLNQREYDALVAAVPEGAFDSGQMPDMVASFSPELEKMRDRGSEEKRLDAGVARAYEMLAERNAEEADEAGRTRIEQHLHGDDPEPEEGSQEDRLERSVQVAWALQASDDEREAVLAETGDPPGDGDGDDAGGGEEE